jgi:uncharacterized protein YbjT (DUF2867 family)
VTDVSYRAVTALSYDASAVRLLTNPSDEEHSMQTKKKIAVAGATGRVGRHAVDLLGAAGHEVVAISRSGGVDVITGAGLAEALTGVECIIDAATGSSPDEETATEFFTTAARNLHVVGREAGVQRIVAVSIIGTDRFTAGYGAAKIAHERALLSGPIPARILRAAQFHEFVEQMVAWGRKGDVSYVPEMRTQLVAARSVAETLVDLATDEGFDAAPISEIAGPREERLFDIAKLYAARRGDPARIEEMSDPDDPNHVLNVNGALLPGPDAKLVGPTFAEWLDATS